jgi:hypothetical protein
MAKEDIYWMPVERRKKSRPKRRCKDDVKKAMKPGGFQGDWHD